MKRKRLTSLSLDFVSAVDRPAQEPATAAILKRDGVELPLADENEVAYIKRLLDEGKIDEARKAAEVKKFVIMTTPVDGHTHLIYTGRFDGGEDKAGSSSWQDEHTHPWIKNEFGNVQIGAAAGHVHEVAILTKQDKTTAEEAATMGTEKKTPEELAAESATTIKTLEAELAKSRTINGLNDAQKAHFATLKGDAADAFLAKSSDERDEVIKAATLADDVVFKAADGTVYRKSDDPRLVTMARKADEDRATIASERNARRVAEYEKRADDELPNMAGDKAVKVALLKAVDEIADTELRGKVVESLKAADGKLAASFETRGTMGKSDTAGNPHAEIEKLAREHAKQHNVSFEKAYSAVLDTPQGAELYKKHAEQNPTL